MRMILVLALLTLTGCITGQKNRQEGGTVTAIPPKITDWLLQQSDREKFNTELEGQKEELQKQITASSNATQAQLSGLLNASVSKLGEKVTGVEARVSELVKLNATMNNTASAELKTSLDKVNAEITGIKAQMTNIVSLQNNMKAELSAITEIRAQLSAVADIKLQLGKVTADVEAQAGVNNSIDKKIEDIKQTFVSSAGRDVNMLPKQAVDIITDSWRNFGIIIGLLLGAATTIISLSFKYARQRAEKRFEIEKQTKENAYKLLHDALIEIPPEKATNLRGKLGEQNA